MIKGKKLLWAMSSILLLSACTPTEAVTEEIKAPSSIDSSVEVASMATDTKESKENEEVYSDSVVEYCEQIEPPVRMIEPASAINRATQCNRESH